MTHQPKVQQDRGARDAAWFVLGWKAHKRSVNADDTPTEIVDAVMDEIAPRLDDYVRPYADVLRSLLRVSPFREIDASHEQSLCSWCWRTEAEGHDGDCAWLRAQELVG